MIEINLENQTPYKKVEEFVHLLKEAMKYGYEISFDETSMFSFSPVEILLDSLIDIMLIIRKMFDIGSQGPKKNEGLGFSEKYQDALGNPKQFKIRTPRDFYWDPDAANYMLRLASTFVSIKGKTTFKRAFAAFFDELNLKPHSSKKMRKTQKSKANYHYWRRHKKL